MSSVQIVSSQKIALVVGATGLIGRHLVQELLYSKVYSKVHVISRRTLGFEHPNLKEHLVNFDDLPAYFTKDFASAEGIKGHDFFCCLGTTMKKAKTKANFRKVDFDYPLKTAELAIEHGYKQMILVSSVGADAKSFFFYSQVKGELEEAIMKMRFWAIHIMRPSVLIGARKEHRFGETFAAGLGKIVRGIAGNRFAKYQPIEGAVVAQKMLRAAQLTNPGVHIYESQKLQEL